MSDLESTLSQLGLTHQQFYDQSQREGCVGTWIYVVDTGDYWWSDAVYHIYGLPKSTPLVPGLFLSRVCSEDRERVRAAFQRLEKHPTYYVSHRVRVDGETKWLEQRGRYYRGGSRHPPYVVGMVRDVTALKLEESRLDSRRADFAAITGYLAETTDTTDLRSIVASVKRTIRKRMDVAIIAVFVRRGDEVSRVIPSGMDPMRAFVFQDIRDYVGYRTVLTGRQSFCAVADYPNDLGREAIYAAGGKAVVSYPIRHGRKTIGALGVVIKREGGLTRNEQEFCRTICSYLSNQMSNALLYERLREELERRRRLESDRDVIFNESVDLIAIIDAEGCFTQINPAFAARLGHSPEALIGRPVFDYIYPDDRDYARYTFNQLSDQEVIRGFCNRFLCAGGEVAYLENNLKYMKDNRSTIAIARDVTNQREVEERNSALEKTVALEKLKSEFFANLSHEYKTPLNIILSSLDLIRMKYIRENPRDFRATYGKYFDYAYQNCYKLLRLTSNLLDTSRIDSQYFRLDLAPKDLADLLPDIVGSAEGYAGARGLTLSFRSGVDHGAWVNCDGGGVDRIVLNLLSNAIKHSPSGGTILVFLEEEGEVYRVAVEDQGHGVAAEFLPYIFDKFRTERAGLSDRQDGSGIGLYLVKSLTEMHGGVVCVESRPGEGCRFSFTLPKLGEEVELPASTGDPLRLGIYQSRAKLELSDLS